MVMQRQWSELDTTTAKLFHAMPHVFEQGARDGTIQLPEWTVLQQWRAKCKCDAQIVESANSILTKMTDLAPRIDQQLLASRFTQKHELNSRGGGGEAVRAVLADIVPLHNGHVYKAFCSDYSRWTDVKGVHAPVPLTDIDGVRAQQLLRHVPTPSRRVHLQHHLYHGLNPACSCQTLSGFRCMRCAPLRSLIFNGHVHGILSSQTNVFGSRVVLMCHTHLQVPLAFFVSAS